MKWCAPFICGAAIGWIFPHHLTPVYAIVCVLLTASALLRILAPRSSLSAPAEFLLLLSFGALKSMYDGGSNGGSDIALSNGSGPQCIVEGVIAESPQTSGRSVRFLMEVAQSGRGDSLREASGLVLVSVSRRHMDMGVMDSLVAGRKVRLQGTLSAPAPPRNPGEFDTRTYFRLNGISSRLLADTLGRNSVLSGIERPFIAGIVLPVREHASAAIDTLIGGEEGNFLKGLLLGERSTIPADVKSEFINAGVMHILAVSGLHVAIVSMILLMFFRMLRLPGRTAIAVTIVSLVYYNFLTGGAASVTRSVIMACVVLAGTLLERKSDMYNSLGVSALIIMLVDTRQLFQPGFQLSFVAVFSLVYLYPKVELLWAMAPERVTEHSALRWLLAGLTITLAAGIGTLPFTALYFGRVSIIGFVANLVAVPLSNVILAIGMLAVGVWFCLPWLGAIYAQAAYGLTWVFLKIVAWFGTMPHASILTRFTLFSSVLFYVTVGLVIGLADPRRRFACAGLLLLGMNGAAWFPLFRPDKEVLRVTMVDVGQGDAILLELPHGKSLLVDAGPKTPGVDAGSRFVVPLLRWQERASCDGIIMTHPHSDHNGGIPSVLRAGSAGRIFEAGVPPLTAIDTLCGWLADSLRVPRDTVRRGMVLDLDPCMRLYVLHPVARYVHLQAGERMNLNNSSVVIKLVFGGTSMLLMGDAEEEVEQQLCERYGDFLRADILKAGHHGSSTSSSARFLEMVHPSSTLISVGTNNKFGHPSPAVLQRYAMMGIRYERTDLEGAVVVESDGERWERVRWE